MANDKFIYQLILNPTKKVRTKQADSRKFARMIQDKLQNIMDQLASTDKNITIDGMTFDKTTAQASLIINNKLSELEAQNTQNNSYLNVMKRTEDSLRQMLG